MKSAGDEEIMARLLLSVLELAWRTVSRRVSRESMIVVVDFNVVEEEEEDGFVWSVNSLPVEEEEEEDFSSCCFVGVCGVR